MIDHVANRDDSDETAALDYGKMPNLPRGHPLHDLMDCVGLRARLDLPRHHFSNGLVTKSTGTCNSDVSSEQAHDIAFGQNPDYILISISDHCGTDLMLVENFDGVAKRQRRLDRGNGIAFVGQDSFDCHGHPPYADTLASNVLSHEPQQFDVGALVTYSISSPIAGALIYIKRCGAVHENASLATWRPSARHWGAPPAVLAIADDVIE